ncbi:hypothetical protein [Alkalihalobacillus pseudalcaliphilus]|uniref:hypothetical protein n=1 Tax=Alkalihalobacillus pseudalcaliphilus TaxID=79884 RepID=UPI00064DCA0C|nr:hypothetical protein [Alkalihalobacillus pseudalcaliphilus]KMK75838.1 hypothetical protein AB990_11275 [Alkalihalobacillus pseudalcaliphilus]
MGSVLFQLISILFIIMPIALIIIISIYVVRTVRRLERRADERLKIEQKVLETQQTHQQSMEKLDHRLTNIEKMLKEVD